MTSWHRFLFQTHLIPLLTGVLGFNLSKTDHYSLSLAKWDPTKSTKIMKSWNVYDNGSLTASACMEAKYCMARSFKFTEKVNPHFCDQINTFIQISFCTHWIIFLIISPSLKSIIDYNFLQIVFSKQIVLNKIWGSIHPQTPNHQGWITCSFR